MSTAAGYTFAPQGVDCSACAPASHTMCGTPHLCHLHRPSGA